MVRALREVEAMTDGTIVDVASLERWDDEDGVRCRWRLNVSLLTPDAETPEQYRVVVAGDGSLHDYEVDEAAAGGRAR